MQSKWNRNAVIFLTTSLSMCVIAIGIAACSRPSLPSVPSPRPLKWATTIVPNSGGPACDTIACFRAALLTMDGLMRVANVGPNASVVVPSLLDHWERHDNRYTFWIAPRRWASGHAVTAQDFERSWLALLRRCRDDRHANILFDIVGARSFCLGLASRAQVQLRVHSEQSFSVDLYSGHPSFLWNLAHPALFPWAGRAAPDDSVGPFRLAAPGAAGVYLPNPEFPRAGPASISRLEIVAEPDAGLRFDRFRDGEVDLADDFSIGVVEAFRGTSDQVRVIQGPPLHAVLHPWRRPFQSVAARAHWVQSWDPGQWNRLLGWPEFDPTFATPPAVGPLALPPPHDAKLSVENDADFDGSVAWLAPSPTPAWNALTENLRAQWGNDIGWRTDFSPLAAPALVLQSEQWHLFFPESFFSWLRWGATSPLSGWRSTQWDQLWNRYREARTPFDAEEGLRAMGQYLRDVEHLLVTIPGPPSFFLQRGLRDLRVVQTQLFDFRDVRFE